MTDARRRGTARWGLALIVCVAAAALLGPWIAPHDPLRGDVERRLEPPSREYLLGTDRLGRCQLSRTLVGGRTSLGLAVLGSAAVTSVALLMGALGAFGGRLADRIVTRLINVFISFPSLVLALALVGVMGPSAAAVVAAIAWAWWPSEARVVRSLFHTARHRDFVDAAWLAGVHPVRILTRHVWPQVGPVLAVRLSLEVSSVILALSTLSFLGLGTQPPHPEWGVMLNEARPFVTTAPHLLLGPGLALIVSVLGCNLVAEGLRERMDVRQPEEW
ncbi:MAG: ABC transporter permease [Bryobacterales bacterium]|nr:ABC transporter permease [Bryobacterales bacterium]